MLQLFIAFIAAILIISAFIINRYFAKKGQITNSMVYPSVIVGGSLGLIIGLVGEGSVAGIILTMVILTLLVFIQMFILHRISKLIGPMRKHREE
ncbi:hypothetical protein GCM10007216_28960 [Thalassobacillus devorans]|uniref:Uncharacterized protein n=1 Tax=Thalassobacillus devorans TaxID=279813 RepID=A0ABQ1PG28_9BACI|nr:hypothetical protein [Thalassobacillus devorans]NIK29401.1 ABC-type uncharacterized transport system permease subunit [Thalassobacillus devorans]GGC96383.1 hypothetical protein GCM10007216_28960 [Thalassobacillus devorans]